MCRFLYFLNRVRYDENIGKKVKSTLKIEQTFLALGEQQSLDTLTISSLAKASGINRVTFYKNYRSMEDLIKGVLLKHIFFDPATSQETISLESSFQFMIQFTKMYPRFCYNLVHSTYGSIVYDFVQNEVMNYQLAEFRRQDIHANVSDNERKVAARFFASGITTTFIHWIATNYEQPIKEVYQTTLTITKGFVDRLIQKKISR